MASSTEEEGVANYRPIYDAMNMLRPGETAYAMKTGAIVHIDQIEAKERGLACGCVCAECGGAMVARKGDLRAHHFAHHASTNCAGGAETALHLKGKEVLATLSCLTLPSVLCLDNRRELIPVETVSIESVELEKTMGEIRPDAVVRTSDGRSILVEIPLPFELSRGELSTLVEAIGSSIRCKGWIRHPAAPRRAPVSRDENQPTTRAPTAGAGSKWDCRLAIRDIGLSTRELDLAESRIEVFYQAHGRYPSQAEFLGRIARAAGNAADRECAGQALARLTANEGPSC
ncbi:competence protein CoiA family protein [Salinisphaera hydrothermalis]|uniref:competence protein CoiA family protein n=1 Tax=Salinisphaera hydrothermalis TaxID=563188 RepID=UPI0033428E29